MRRRVATDHDLLHAERAELRASLEKEREALVRAREEDKRAREAEKIELLQRAVSMREHVQAVRWKGLAYT